MKRIRRDTLIDLLIWIVIITQLILLGSLAYTLHMIGTAIDSSSYNQVSMDINSYSGTKAKSMNDYISFREELWEVVSRKVPKPEPTQVLTGKDLYVSYIYEICESYPNVDPEVFISLVEHESHYNPNAKNYNGSCIGLSQLSVKWHTKRAEQLGVTDLWDPYGNLLTGIDYFSDLMESAGGEAELAVMLYHMKASSAWEQWNSGKIDLYARSVIRMSEEV